MKEFKFILEENELEDMKKPIRDKQSLIQLLLKTIKFMLYKEQFIDNNNGIWDESRRLILRIDKMSRLVYCFENKIFSYNFPFLIDINNGENDNLIEVYSNKSSININNKVTTVLLAIFGNRIYNSLDEFQVLFLEEIDSFDEWNYVDEYWKITNELLNFEPGYLRYDYDETRADEILHPLYHLDVFYSPNNTFKIGLHTGVDENSLMDILDINVGCKYFER